jgi:hypothetical protein
LKQPSSDLATLKLNDNQHLPLSKKKTTNICILSNQAIRRKQQLHLNEVVGMQLVRQQAISRKIGLKYVLSNGR